MFELILAANYLDIKMLLDLSCAKVASMIKGKSPEEIRKTFNIKNDFTPEEEAATLAAAAAAVPPKPTLEELQAQLAALSAQIAALAGAA